MRQALAIAGREMGAMFRLPAGWIVIALYLLLAGVVFTQAILLPGQPASLREFFAISGWLLMPVIPAIAMRLFSEEFRSGTIEPLMTAPVGDWTLVLAKYLGACGFLFAMLAPTVLYPITLYLMADPRPDVGPILSGYLSLFLQGTFYLAIGLFASSLTANQTLAFLLTLFSIFGMLVLSTMGPQLARGISSGWLGDVVREVLGSLSVAARVEDFARGVIDTAHIVFFVSLSSLFLVLAVVAIQSRRWR
jgi:ABC-2 type transport system permease protein